jgi:hypothetical protein
MVTAAMTHMHLDPRGRLDHVDLAMTVGRRGDDVGAVMTGRLAARLAVALVIAIGASGCPRLPPPLPRPAARVVSLESGVGPAAPLRARLDLWNRGSARLVLAAVDWELTDVRGDVVLARGRASVRRAFAPDERAAVAIDLAMAPSVTAAVRGGAPDARARLRGTAHLEDPDGGEGAPASFDDPVTLPVSREPPG